jgi:hypothetical protein
MAKRLHIILPKTENIAKRSLLFITLEDKICVRFLNNPNFKDFVQNIERVFANLFNRKVSYSLSADRILFLEKGSQ